MAQGTPFLVERLRLAAEGLSLAVSKAQGFVECKYTHCVSCLVLPPLNVVAEMRAFDLALLLTLTLAVNAPALPSSGAHNAFSVPLAGPTKTSNQDCGCARGCCSCFCICHSRVNGTAVLLVGCECGAALCYRFAHRRWLLLSQ